jgi:hypothetical protein
MLVFFTLRAIPKSEVDIPVERLEVTDGSEPGDVLDARQTQRDGPGEDRK